MKQIVEIKNAINQWEPDQKGVCIEAIRTSKLEGFEEAARPNTHPLKRLFWTLSFGFCGYQAVIFSLQSIDDFSNRPILYTFKGTISAENVPFPGVTITSSSLFDPSMINDVLQLCDQLLLEPNVLWKDGRQWSRPEAFKLLYFMHHICDQGGSFLGQMLDQIFMDNNVVLSQLNTFLHRFKDEHAIFKDSPLDGTYSAKILPYVKEGLINCSKLLIVCSWRKSLQDDCDSLFYPSQTDVGSGCSFNRVPDSVLRGDEGLQASLNQRGSIVADEIKYRWGNWNIDNHHFFGGSVYEDIHGFSVPSRQSIAGKPYGLSFFLYFDDAELDQDILCPVYDGKGYLLALHPSHEEPQTVLSGILIPPKKEVFIEVKAEVTTSDPRIRQINVDKRQCYFQEENPLKNFTKYTESNCRRECIAKKILKQCGCHQLSMTTGKNETICGPNKRLCVDDILQLFGKVGYAKLCRRPMCYAPCTQVTYASKMTSIPLKSVHLKKVKSFLNISRKRAVSIVHVFVASQTMVSRERKLKYDWSEIFGILGGIWGLMLGISAMRLINVFAAITVIISGIFHLCPIVGAFLQRLKNRCQLEVDSRSEMERNNLSEASTSQNTKKIVNVLKKNMIDNHSNNEEEPDPNALRSIFVVRNRVIQERELNVI